MADRSGVAVLLAGACCLAAHRCAVAPDQWGALWWCGAFVLALAALVDLVLSWRTR